jgi:hypothetical protein
MAFNWHDDKGLKGSGLRWEQEIVRYWAFPLKPIPLGKDKWGHDDLLAGKVRMTKSAALKAVKRGYIEWSVWDQNTRSNKFIQIPVDQFEIRIETETRVSKAFPLDTGKFIEDNRRKSRKKA